MRASWQRARCGPETLSSWRAISHDLKVPSRSPASHSKIGAEETMVRDGIYYALAFTAAGAFVTYLAGAWYGLALYLVGAFCAYFFRDPERMTPAGDIAVSPADGKVVAVVAESGRQTRVSIFLNIFDVHVNRMPFSGVIADVRYSKGKFLVASH